MGVFSPDLLFRFKIAVVGIEKTVLWHLKKILEEKVCDRVGTRSKNLDPDRTENGPQPFYANFPENFVRTFLSKSRPGLDLGLDNFLGKKIGEKVY